MKKKGHGTVVVGGQWGDEGKGRIVDIIANTCTATVRYHGGNNAGHSLHFDNQSLVLHLIPCGIVRKGNIAIIGNGVVIDPEVLFKEMQDLKEHGILCTPDNLKISAHAHVILPIHRDIDQQRESEAKSSLGTTKRGIGPCYEDKVGRFGVRMGDLLHPHLLSKKIQNLLHRHGQQGAEKHEAMLKHALSFGDKIQPFLCDSGEIIDDLLKKDARILFEGAQGALLDVDHGSYPYVTSSNCVAAQAAIGSGVGPTAIDEVLMVTKAYCTRVGDGPFLTELEEKDQDRFRKKGNEFGATTGRPRRCGWLDLPALKYAARINGATGIIITKFDILEDLGPIKVAIAYRTEDQKTLSFSDAIDRTLLGERIYPVYQEFAGIGVIPTTIKKFDDLPPSFRQICQLIEREIGVPVVMVSYGKERGQELLLR